MQGKTEVVDCLIVDMATLSDEGLNADKQFINRQLGNKYTLIEENGSLIVIQPNIYGEKIKQKYQFLGNTPFDKTFFDPSSATTLFTIDHDIFEKPSFATKSVNANRFINNWLLSCDP